MKNGSDPGIREASNPSPGLRKRQADEVSVDTHYEGTTNRDIRLKSGIESSKKAKQHHKDTGNSNTDFARLDDRNGDLPPIVHTPLVQVPSNNMGSICECPEWQMTHGLHYKNRLVCCVDVGGDLH